MGALGGATPAAAAAAGVEPGLCPEGESQACPLGHEHQPKCPRADLLLTVEMTGMIRGFWRLPGTGSQARTNQNQPEECETLSKC